jgi:coenzyme F420-reducing hydrogenase alpha subunit
MKRKIFVSPFLFYKYKGVKFFYTIPESRMNAYDQVMKTYANDIYNTTRLDSNEWHSVFMKAKETLENVFREEAIKNLLEDYYEYFTKN